MTSAAHTGNIEKVKKALAEHDESGLTTREVAKLCGLTRDQAAALIRCLHTKTPRFPEKRVYIYYWRETGEQGEKVYPRAVYRLGNARDTPKPPPKPGSKKSREYRTRQQAKNQTTSVFNLGNTGYRTPAQKQRQAEYDRRRDRNQRELF